MEERKRSRVLLELTTRIVSAYFTRSPVASAELPAVITDVHAALVSVGSADGSNASASAVPIECSVTQDHIVCLEDGKRLKTLKRHLMRAHGLTPDTYRERWGLSPDYPMVAPNYARHRSKLAREIGLGTKTRRR